MFLIYLLLIDVFSINITHPSTRQWEYVTEECQCTILVVCPLWTRRPWWVRSSCLRPRPSSWEGLPPARGTGPSAAYRSPASQPAQPVPPKYQQPSHHIQVIVENTQCTLHQCIGSESVWIRFILANNFSQNYGKLKKKKKDPISWIADQKRCTPLTISNVSFLIKFKNSRAHIFIGYNPYKESQIYS